jgi:hypothetical protein
MGMENTSHNSKGSTAMLRIMSKSDICTIYSNVDGVDSVDIGATVSGFLAWAKEFNHRIDFAAVVSVGTDGDIRFASVDVFVGNDSHQSYDMAKNYIQENQI